jgi:HAD superfamily hydrolase (TIGR01493 family)
MRIDAGRSVQGSRSSVQCSRESVASGPALACPPAARAEKLTPLPVRGIVFEMAGVLYDATLWRRWLVQLLARFGLAVEYGQFYEAWDREFLVDVHCGRREFCEALQAFLLRSGLTWGQIDEIEAASRRRQQELEDEARPLPGVAATISQLARAGLPLAVLANSPHPARELEARLARMGLDHAIGTVLSSLELEAAKPEAICYQAALHALGLEPQEVLFVGQRGEDLVGAAALGMRTAAVHHGPGVSADIVLSLFSQLPQAIALPALAC